MQKTISLLLALLAVLSSPLLADTTKTPDPQQLESSWWAYFSNSTGEELTTHIHTFTNDLHAAIAKLPPEEQKQSKDLLDKIQTELKEYEQLSKQPPPAAPVSSAIASTYSVDRILKLNQSMRKLTIEIKGLREDREDKSRLLGQQQELLTKQQTAYKNQEKRSEGRILTGLSVIETRIQSETLKKNIANLDQTLINKNEELRLLTEEMNTALTRINVSELEILAMAQQVREKNQEWQAAKEALQAVEAQRSAQAASSSKGEEDEKTQLLVQNTIEAEINESIVHVQLVLAQIELALGESIHNAESINLSEMREQAAKWDGELSAIKKRTSNWKTTLDRQIQRTSQNLANKAEGSLSPVQKQILAVSQNDLLLLQRLKIEMDDAGFMLDVLDHHVSLFMGTGQLWKLQTLDFFTSIFSSLGDWFSKELFPIGNTSITPIGILRFLLILALTIWISRFVLRGFSAFAKTRPGVNKSVVYRVTRLIQYLIITIGTLIALSSLGFDFSNLILIAGALGVGIGFGLQSIFNNFISGIIILFESQLKVGDYIEMESGIKGEIREINVRSTVITDNDGIDVLIPNSEIISSKISNWTLKVPYRRIHVPFSAAYGQTKILLRGSSWMRQRNSRTLSTRSAFRNRRSI